MVSGDGADRAKEDFFSEAQDLIENLSKHLLAIDDLLKDDRVDHSIVNDAFRAVHTLKGLAGLFGAESMALLSHQLEEAMDALRLGKLEISDEVIDLLFHSVELYWQTLAAERGEHQAPDLDAFIERVRLVSGKAPPAPDIDSEYNLQSGLLAVLTEYEESRLRANLSAGNRLFRVKLSFSLMTIDTEIEEAKDLVKPLGEVITYLPGGASLDPDYLDLELVVACHVEQAVVEAAFAERSAEISEFERIPTKKGETNHSERKHSEAKTPLTQAPSSKGDAVTSSAFPIDSFESSSKLSAASKEETALASQHPEAQNPLMRSVSRSVRVDIRRLDGLMNIVGELAIVRGLISKMSEELRSGGHRQLSTELYRIHRTFDRKLGELQSGILDVRMVPLGQVFDRLQRVVRQIGREVGKEVRMVVSGADTEIDKLIVEELSDPLMHIIRNCIDHGIEFQDERAELGKPLSGTVALNAYHKGNHVIIEVEDDGAGVDHNALVEKAVALGKISRAEADSLTRDEALSLIFMAGLSSKTEASQYSGRGVGMDVVKTNIAKLGGIVDLHSERHIGTKFTITLPITLAIVNSLLIRIYGVIYALPLTSVSEALSLEMKSIRVVDGREILSLRGESLPILRTGLFFGLRREGPAPKREFVVVAALGNRRLGLVVDDMLGQQDIVIKPLGATLSDVRGFSGATELGDQRVALVIDAAALIDETLLAQDNFREGRFFHV